MSKKVLVCTTELLPYSQTFILEQIRSLSTWNAVLVGKSTIPGLDLTGLDVLVLDSGKSILAKAIDDFRLLFSHPQGKHLSLLENQQADLVHVHFGNFAPVFWPVAKRLDLPMIVTLHGTDINIHKDHWRKGVRGWLWNYPARLEKISTAGHVYFIAVSEAIKRRAIEYGLPEQRIQVCHIGVDTHRFRPGPLPIEQCRDILFVGRLAENKGCIYLLEAFSGIQDRFPESELVIVGNGPLEHDLRTHASEKGIRARFLGALPSDKVLEQMQKARVLCLPSVTIANGSSEGFGLVLLEAQACGVPVITSARGGVEEGILDGKTGFAHREKDVSAIRDALARLLADDDLSRQFSRDARIFVTNRFSIASCTKKLEAIYDSVCACS